MKTLVLTALSLCLLANRTSAAPIGTAFTYQGALSGAGAASTGTFDFQFSLFDAASAGNQVGQTLLVPAVQVNNGFFTATLDFGNVFDGNARWLALGVRTSGSTGAFAALTPLQELAPTPYALFANNGGQNSIQTGATDAFIGGGYQNIIQSGSSDSTIAGGFMNVIQANAPNSSIGGGYYNSADEQLSTIAGGASNMIQSGALYSTVGGGVTNLIQSGASDSTIGGGAFNTVSNSAVGSTIGGGILNGAGDANSTVAGGYDNTAGAQGSTIGGGANNSIQPDADQSTIAGGQDNTITSLGLWSTVGGGYLNTVQAQWSTIGGGSNNIVDTECSTIAGGFSNRISYGALYSAIGGGNHNIVSGWGATVPGGINNIAAGTGSFAAGSQAVASGSGCFAWGDGTRLLQSLGDNTFNVLATGGFFFYDNINPTNLNAGVALAPGDTSWRTLSDRNAKKNFKRLDTQAVLEKLAAIPVQQWNYKWEKDTDTPNIGPTAQDFKHAFYPGREDKGITTLEFDGVELAAIQGLNEKLEQRLKEKDARIAQLEKELAEVKSIQQQAAEQFESLRRLVERVANESTERQAALAGSSRNTSQTGETRQ